MSEVIAERRPLPIKDARPARPVTYAESVQHFAAIAAGEKNWRQSALLFGYCQRAYADLDAHLDYAEKREYDELVVILNKNLAADAVVALLAEGRGLTDDQTYDEALKV